MAIWGLLLYPIMAIIIVSMWRRVQGMTIEEIVAKSAAEHHNLIKIFEQHPQGGDWDEFQQWSRM